VFGHSVVAAVIVAPSVYSRSRLLPVRYLAWPYIALLTRYCPVHHDLIQVSVDVEGEIYRLAGRSGIALFTVSHRKSLWEHHSVSFDTCGGFPNET